MDPASSIPAIFALAMAVLTVFILRKIFGPPENSGRFLSIDGLRGFLAFFVFLHHACIWYFYLRTGKWEIPPSRLYTHFGQSAVSLFFMITAFLFTKKILDAKENKIDWLKLYSSRFLRLTPLYFSALIIVFLLTFTVSNWQLNESIPKLGLGLFKWLIFTAFGAPDLNGVDNTFTIIAGVTWSLPYEWAFYLLLPIMALTRSIRAPVACLALGLLSIIFIARHPDIRYLAFIGGIIAAFFVRSENFTNFASNKLSSIVCILCISVMVSCFPLGNGPIQLVLLTIFFTLIASGNSLFGILSNPTSRLLGEFAYGIYLIHGILLFLVFNTQTGIASASSLTPIQHWTIIIGITPVVVIAGFAAYKFIEYPAMQQTNKLTAALRSLISKLEPRSSN